MEKQKTIAKEVSLNGIGLHTANKVNVTFKPADIDKGINFVRTDLPNNPVIKASPEYILSQGRAPHRRTSLVLGSVEVNTIEHLMAALAGLGIDNINIEIDNSELPGLDGSSLIFLEIIKRAGIKEQQKARQYYLVKEPIFIEEDGASIIALPSQEFRISYTLSYNHPLLKAQFLDITVQAGTFEKELGPARTFCLEEEASELQRIGLGQGANYSNTLVLGKSGVINNELRYPDELIRHKISDLFGDLYLLGSPLKGHIIALKSGHSLNIKLVKKINQQKQRYSLAAIGIDYHPGEGEELDREAIMRILPHRPPFLFVDKITRLELGKSATGIKYLTMEDDFFRGHFPGKPIMPGVLIVEAMAQVGGVMMLAPEKNRGKLAYFLAAENVKFRKTVVPGDELTLEVEADKIKSKTGRVRAKAFVNGKIVAEADLMFALVDSR
ncbi:MAG: bifunctional UDP-3-O-[3-hydroxymyristoyl] N-acetylglucosamine deacetylase/3-hydroxyacyl-ACP dehydratase [Candidatus Omnitrophica bacterium]|nr:bifunctional UDP-3-O-[3-hydroxymyristoyl] N-acetylglucosamine deacetylase/3-hydroxyacyl-ACP dehydratase [Candidatus Omnitrophota bacterium]